MPAYPPHVLVAFGGTATERTAGDEIWQCGIRMIRADGDAPDSDDLDTYLGEIAGPLNTWFTSAGAKNRSDAKLAWVKANAINVDGTYRDPVTHRLDYGVPAAGANATQSAPAFTCVVLSWQTAISRGLGAKGRIFPPNCASVGSGSQILPADETSIRNAGKVLLNALANTSSTSATRRLIPAVVSAGNATTGVPANPITGIRTGDIFDYHSSRKRKLPEIYASIAYP